MARGADKVVILGTGGTIAGTAAQATDNVGYRAGQLGVERLVAAVPALAGAALETEQVAQVDSKDMTLALMRRLAGRIEAHLARAEVAGVVVTHGTDTLEETAYALHRTLAAPKPVVLTAAMRPASSLQADGPQNLLDAVALARHGAAAGVAVVIGGRAWAAAEVRKVHSYRLDAFDAGDAGALGWVEEGRWCLVRNAPPSTGLGDAALPDDDTTAPWVAILGSHAGAGGREVEALAAAGVRGLVIAATGNGTLHVALQAALARAQAQGVAVMVASRCAFGGVVEATTGGAPAPFASAGRLTPAQARIELLLHLARG